MRVARVARGILKETPGLIVHTTTGALLDARGPLASIWLQVHPHSQQDDSHSLDIDGIPYSSGKST